MATQELDAQIAKFSETFNDLRNEVGRVLVGQETMVTRLLIGLLTGGHVLLEGLPGLAKTLTLRSLAAAIDTGFSRIQFTPDMLPADVIGTEIFNPKEASYQVRKGPIFSNLVLADEINRAPAKVQAALLEAMQERQGTIGGETFLLEEPFLVLATQNPIEQEGTYPLPEAQLDRFFVKLMVPYPTAAELSTILNRTTGGEDQQAEPILSGERILELRQMARQIPVADDVQRYAVGMVLGTHPDQEAASDMVRRFVRFGASPRGAQALILYAKILAVLDGRFHVAREDINAAAVPVLRHRVILSFEGQAQNVSTDDVIRDLMM